MISKQGMTIQEYFSRVGITASIHSNPLTNVSPRADGNGQFDLILNRLQGTQMAGGQKVTRGLCITDYLAHRVRASVSRAMYDMTNRDRLGRKANPVETALPRSTDQLPTAYTQNVIPKQQTPSTVQAKDSIQQRIELSVQKASTQYNLPSDLIRSVIRAESNFQPDAVSPAGALGLMQLMPATAEELGVSDPLDIEQNIDGGARYLRQMLNMFDNNIKKALAAYNAGPGTVARYDGNVPYRETRNYVQKVLAYAKQMV